MVEKRIEVPVTPEGTKLEGGNLRRISTGKTTTLNSREKIPPHYLRASTGSCHDFCKFGRERALLAKEKRPIRKKITATSSEDQVLVKSVTLAQRQKKSIIELKPSLVSKTLIIPDTPKIIIRNISSFAKKVPSPLKKINASATGASALKLKPKITKPSSSSISPLGVSSSRRDRDVKTGKNYGASKTSEKKGLVPPMASLFPGPVKSVASLNARKWRNPKGLSPLKNRNKDGKAERKQPSVEKVREKSLYVIEPKSENRSLQSKRSSPSLSSSMSLLPATFLPLPLHEEEQHVISESTLSEVNASVTKHEEGERKKQKVISKAECKRLPRSGAMVHPDVKDLPPRKLNFRRGRVVDLQFENNGPRRLRFRQGRMSGENQNGKSDGRRSFRRRTELGINDSDGSKPESVRVVLRHHQDVQGKKAAQGLFNNVIEQTASTLVATRKSKVLALVGAFETVISLQESKPSTPRS